MLDKCKAFKEKFSKAIKVSHYSLLGLGTYKAFEIVKAIIGAF